MIATRGAADNRVHFPGIVRGVAVSAERELDRTSANPFLTVGSRVTAKSEKPGRIFVCGLSYGLRMKTSAGSLNRCLSKRSHRPKRTVSHNRCRGWKLTRQGALWLPGGGFSIKMGSGVRSPKAVLALWICFSQLVALNLCKPIE